MTTRGIVEEDTKRIASLIHNAIKNRNDDNKLNVIHSEIVEFCSHFPIPSV